MIVQINRELLHQAAKVAATAAVVNRDMPEISGILMEADEDIGEIQLTGTNIRTFIRKRLQGKDVHIEKGGRIVLKARLFVEMLARLDGEVVSFKQYGPEVWISSGSATYTVVSMSPDAFPKFDVPFPEETVSITGIHNLLRRVLYAASCQDNQPTLQGISIDLQKESSRASAADGYRMAAGYSPHCSDGELHVVLHNKAVQTLLRIAPKNDPLYVGVVNRYAVFFNREILFATMLLNEPPVPINAVLSHIKPSAYALVDAKNFFSAYYVIANSFRATDDLCVNLKVLEATAFIGAETGSGKVQAKVKAEKAKPTSLEGSNYSPRLLVDFLQRASGPLELIFDETGFLILKANQSFCAVPPRGPARTQAPEKKNGKQGKRKGKKEDIAA
ncbi:DNA polymerase III subunit beta [Solibaculum mannosilyticum]|uniref:DNA polymerase III subunit beta n=1 Tax=Solibaculum mannosilyticum TaxID=2780922 RepID=A0A7I8D716_9FIRM|nr:DNA polymerase III subunit beta [Solibaculum mannosilyticum]BCI61013.1 hypothetical protein C12CBH8_16520 [Solibaculum mannosilyticum]